MKSIYRTRILWRHSLKIAPLLQGPKYFTFRITPVPSTTNFLLNYLNGLSRIIHHVETVWQPARIFAQTRRPFIGEKLREILHEIRSKAAQFHEPAVSRLLTRVGKNEWKWRDIFLPFETDFRNFSAIFRVHPPVSYRLTRLPTCASAEVVKVFVKSNYRPTYFSFVLSVGSWKRASVLTR